LNTNRIDAEYYQPKYDDLITKVNSFGGGTVKTECNLYDSNFNPKNDVKYKYIELSNIGNFGDINGFTMDLGANLPTRARRIVHNGNIIISSIEGSLQSCAIIPNNFDGALCSTGFYVLDSNKINSETLLVLFKSTPIQALLKQQCTGTILTAYSKDGLLSIPIPKIDNNLQDKIRDSVKESFKLRQNSMDLLEATKQAIEIAIEQDETKAIQYLKSVQ
jgi:restriction endonuclease S subunit